MQKMAWTEILGQPLAVRVLQMHLVQDRIAPAYLFAGPDGVGKRLAARTFATALNCERYPDSPCEVCDQCRRIQRGVHPDLHLLAPKGAADLLRIDDVRAVVGRVVLRPFMGRFQAVILEDADRLTEEAANSLLKILEEPPRQTRFILLTAQPAACLPTIVSRCQVIRFQRLAASLIQRLLEREGHPAEIARPASLLAGGSLAKASAFAAGWSAYQPMLAQVASERPAPWLEWDVPTEREELSRWLACSVAWLRDSAVASARAGTQASRLDRERCIESAMRIAELSDALDRMANPRLVGTLLREEWLDLVS